MSDTVLNFGKYAKLSIAEVFATDVGYAKWLYSQELLIGSKPAIKEFLRSKFQGTDMSYVLSWGKHKNRTINWVKKEDPKYIDWLSSNSYVNDNCPKLKKNVSGVVSLDLDGDNFF